MQQIVGVVLHVKCWENIVTAAGTSVLDEEQLMVFLLRVLAGNIRVMFASRDVLTVVFSGNDTWHIFVINNDNISDNNNDNNSDNNSDNNNDNNKDNNDNNSDNNSDNNNK